jgi:cell division protein FtsB
MTIRQRFKNIEHRITNYKFLNSKVLIRYSKPVFLPSVFCLLFSSLCFLCLAGCNQTNEKAQLLKQVEQLTEENSKLTSRIKQSESENKQLQKRVQVLSDLPDDVKGENVYTIQQIKIGGFTDFYDKNHDGKKETLIVYVQTIDDQGDKIKASGTMDVELWDLDQPESKALLDDWKVGPQELKQLWYATMLTINYRLTFDIINIVDDFDKPYTVKVKFTDYLSGRVFEAQTVIEPQ